MTSKINAITTGAGGIEVTGDSSGQIEFQADGTTVATLTTSGLDVASGLTFGSPIDIASGGTGQTTATAAFNALAPSQSTNSGKYLTTDGTNTSWGTVSVPTVNDATLTLATSGTGLSGSATFTANDADNATFTVTSNATNANTPSTIVARDASGNFSAGTITASLSGNASTVTNGVYTTGSYANPSWITSLDDGKVLPTMTGNSGKYLTTDGTNSSWATITSSQWTTTGSNIYYNTGNVGIGTSSPSTGLEIRSSGAEGNRTLRVAYDGTYYANITQAGAAGLYYRTYGGTEHHWQQNGTECMFIDSSANLKFNSGYGSVATAYGCRAWVNFNGTGTVAIRASGNVSSITDNGTGDYTMNFSTSMPDANYCVQTTVEPESAYPNHVRMSGVYYNTRATGSVRLRTGGVPSELGPDPFGFFVAIIR